MKVGKEKEIDANSEMQWVIFPLAKWHIDKL